MAFAALQWQGTNDKNQLVLGPNGGQAVVSVENFGQISTVKIPDPGTSVTNFVLTDVKGGSQTINGNLVVTGTQTVNGGTTVTGPMTVTGDLTVTGKQTVTGDLAVGGNETVAGNLAVTGTITSSSPPAPLGGDLVFTNLADRQIRFDGPKAAVGADLSIVGNASSTAAGGDIFITSGNATAAGQLGGNLTAAGGTGTLSGGSAGFKGGDGTGNGVGGTLNLEGGAGGGTGGGGGSVVLSGGDATAGNSDGGSLGLSSGDGKNLGKAGDISINGGIAGTTGAATGAKISILGGPGAPTKAGGAVTVEGGAGNTSGTGGVLNLNGGAAGPTGTGGAVVVKAADGSGGGNGGAVTVDAGSGTIKGSINIGTLAVPLAINIGQVGMVAPGSTGTTVFAQRQPVVVTIANKTLTEGESGSLVTIDTAKAAYIVTLPPIAAGLYYEIVNVQTGAKLGAVTITSQTALKVSGVLFAGAAIFPCVGVTSVIFTIAGTPNIGDRLRVESGGTNWLVSGQTQVAGGWATA